MANKDKRRSDNDFINESFNQETQLLNEIFSKFKDYPDQDFIHVDRLTEVMRAFGRNPSLKDSEQRINEFQLAGKFELTLDDVVQILDEPWTAFNNNRDALRQALENFDQTKEGYINVEQFRIAMSTLGEPLSNEELNEIIRLCINEDQKKISINYFLDQLLGNKA